ncbi:hypothetical protein [Geminisphaera colitermitum]|uniref:hypothetical protein n=1 Tax=Geminisphaera colitermitum TaxID=1148786 RepID=UPI0001964E5E|nr:hypothetical protein [Geminisphaera colitermitum]
MKALQEKGQFPATASNTQFGQSDTGSEFIQITFTTDEHETITAWRYLTPAAFEYTVQNLREVFGIDNDAEKWPSQIDGKRCSIVTEFEQYDGKDRLKVRYINTEGGGTKAPKPISNQAAFLRDMTQRTKMLPHATGNTPRPTPARPPTRQTPPPASIADEDVPF